MTVFWKKVFEERDFFGLKLGFPSSLDTNWPRKNSERLRSFRTGSFSILNRSAGMIEGWVGEAVRGRGSFLPLPLSLRRSCLLFVRRKRIVENELASSHNLTMQSERSHGENQFGTHCSRTQHATGGGRRTRTGAGASCRMTEARGLIGGFV